MNVLFVPLYPRDSPLASSRYRIYEYVPDLRARGFQVQVLDPPGRRLWARLRYYLGLMKECRAADVVVIQKRLFPSVVLAAVRKCSRRLLFDMDDALFTCPPDMPDDKFRAHMTLKRLRATLKASDAVVCCNNCLARFTREHNHDVVIIPTPVDIRPIHSRPKGSVLKIGWLGNVAVHDRNLRLLRTPLERLYEDFDFELVLIDSGNDRTVVLADSKFPVRRICTRGEGVLDEIAKVDIGVMPLEDNPWNRGKCAFKILVYMAESLATVASGVGMNADLIVHGQNGYLAHSDEDWYRSLQALAQDPMLRETFGRLGRKTVEGEFSRKACLKEWVVLLERQKTV